MLFVGTKGVSQNHLLSFDDNKVLKLSIGYEGEKNHKKGGVELCFWKLLL